MKITALDSGLYKLSHERFSAAMTGSATAIPGLVKSGTYEVTGASDAISAAIDYLVNERGLDRECFEDKHLLHPQQRGIVTSECDTDARLRCYQREAMRFMRYTKRCILADDMGLGKSASAICAATSFLTQKRVLIVCPSYVRGVWTNPHNGGELQKWAGERLLIFNCGTTKATWISPENQFAVCHYDILHAWAEKLIDWKPEIVIYDEAHYLMNPASQRTKAAMAISRDSQYVWALTGTPMTNRPRDLWGLLSTIVPGRFGEVDKGFFKFGLRYCAAEKVQVTPIKTVWKFDGSSRADELRNRLSHFMLRRTKSEVALELPAKTRQVIRVATGSKSGGAGFVGGDKLALRSVLAAAADAKLDTAAIPLIQAHLEEGRRVVVFTYRKAVAEFIANALGGVFIHSGVSQQRRGKLLDDLRKQDGASLVAGTIDSMSTGIDLSYADVAVFVELTYEPHEFLQAEARLHRFGQKNPVLVQYLVAMGTADELVADMVILKLDTFEAVIGGVQETGLRSSLQQDEASLMKSLYEGLGL